jgi:hypothetical protein
VLLIGGVTTALLMRTPNLAGDWVNDDQSVTDVAEIRIARTGTAVSLQLYRKCSPTNCDVGTLVGQLEKNIAVVQLHPPEGVLKLQLNPSGHLTCRADLNNKVTGAYATTIVWSFHKAG